ncbi:unnamed protein product [Tuber aestivum]|uniref:COX assembly mitochondrial protein n=1 Tax=Tuber aestivum TaxID=59557 RepID=A0A292PPS5_9PEZI|nr:unnamed protein product [Tuber aestivum]
MTTTTAQSTSTSATPPPPPTTSTSEPPPRPRPLSAHQEGQIRDLYYARVRGLCAEEIKQFVECARNRTVSAAWACRDQRRGMNSCMVSHATQENRDIAREEWLSRRGVVEVVGKGRGRVEGKEE